MKTKRILSAVALVGLLVLPVIGLAQEEAPESAPPVVASGAELIELIERIGNWVFSFLLAVAGILLIVAGFFWVTAGGDPGNVIKARTMLINALIGVAIALLARGMVAVIRGIIGG